MSPKVFVTFDNETEEVTKEVLPDVLATHNVPQDAIDHILKSELPELCYYKTNNNAVRSVYVGHSMRVDNHTKLPPARVTDYMYLSDMDFASNDAWRAKRKITHVVHVLPSCICAPNFDQRELINHIDSKNLRIRLYDYEPMDRDLNKAFQPFIDFVDKARAENPKARIVVHCAAGVSRSVTMVLAYLVAREHMTLRAAVSHVFKKRPIISPLLFYIRTLFQLEEGSIVPIHF